MKRHVKVSEIKVTFFVRANLAELDRPRVEFFKQLYLAGAPIPDIEVTEQLELIDGRHRLQAAVELGYETIAVEIKAGLSRSELIAAAVKANSGGAMATTIDDLRLTIQQMRGKAGATDQECLKLLSPPYPAALIKERIAWDRSNQKQLLLRRAEGELGDLSYADAAKKYGVSVDELRAFKKQRGKKHEPTLLAIRKTLGHMNKSHGERLKHYLREVTQASRDGILTPQEAFKLLREPTLHARQVIKRCEDAEQREAARLEIESASTRRVS